MTTLRRIVCAAALVAASPVAQQVQTPARIPIHAQPDGKLWAAGRDYKIEFDGPAVRFFPALGADAPANLPFGWSTTSTEYAIPATSRDDARRVTTRHEPWLYEIDRGGVIERYAIGERGVEQTFLLTEPEGRGDFVVRGTVFGPLRAVTRDPHHASIAYCETTSGDEIVRYGAATAIDAAGDSTPLTTRVADGAIEIRVPAEWLDRAAWPVLIDPLITRAPSAGNPNGPAFHPSLAYDQVFHKYVLSHARPSAGNDFDLFVQVLDLDFRPLATIYSELTTDSVEHSSVGWNVRQYKWHLAMQVERSGVFSRIRLYTHQTADLGLATGTAQWIPSAPDVHLSEPSLGVTASHNVAYLVARRDTGPTPHDSDRSSIVGYPIDTYNLTIGAPADLSSTPGIDLDAAHPQIAPRPNFLGWVAVWQEWQPGSGNGWDAVGRRINVLGAMTGDRAVLANSPDHDLTPTVAGGEDRFLVATVRRPIGAGTKTTDISGDRIITRRFHWTEIDPQPTLEAERALASTPQSDLWLGTATRPMAYDWVTASHWSIAWRNNADDELAIARIGFDGMVAEQTVLEVSTGGAFYFEPTLTFDRDARGVAVAYASAGAAPNDPIYARRFTLDQTASARTLSNGCVGGAASFRNRGRNLPFRGSQFVGVDLEYGVPYAPVWMLVSLSLNPHPLPLGTCQLALDTATLLPSIATGTTSGSGFFSTGFTIPSNAPSTPFYFQFVQLDANQNRLATSIALELIAR